MATVYKLKNADLSDNDPSPRIRAQPDDPDTLSKSAELLIRIRVMLYYHLGHNPKDIMIRPPRYWTPESLIAMTQRLEKEHYSVALNLLVYEDGTIGQASYDMLKEVAQKLKRGKWAKKG